jgi:hypothetical protein
MNLIPDLSYTDGDMDMRIESSFENIGWILMVLGVTERKRSVIPYTRFMVLYRKSIGSG